MQFVPQKEDGQANDPALLQKYFSKIDESWMYTSRNSTPNFIIFTKFGPTDVMTDLSRAKNCEESAGDIRFGVAPQKPRKNAENSTTKVDFVFSGVEK